MKTQFTNEVRNISLHNALGELSAETLEYRVEGGWLDLLERLDVSLAVSREYEHILLTVGVDQGRPWQSAIEIPHPSGIWYQAERGRLAVASTRTPHQIVFFDRANPSQARREIAPEDFRFPDAALFLPRSSWIMAGNLAIHDLVEIGGAFHANVTNHNFIARLSPDGGWERVWWPRCVEAAGDDSFRHNYLQLNSIACAPSLEQAFFTAFSDSIEGAKPWKAGYGPKGKGVVFSGASREVVARDLTCPHSARIRDDGLWICNSGYGEVGVLTVNDHEDPSRNPFRVVTRLPGFTRGLTFVGPYAFVGLSRVVDHYEPYAPGLKPADSRCGVVAIDTRTGETVGSLTWPGGYQVYDVQLLPGVKRPLLPEAGYTEGDVNLLLRFL